MNESDYQSESLNDYFAKSNLEEGRTVWKERRTRIFNIYNRVQKDLEKDMKICEIGIGEGFLLKLLYLDRYRNLTGIDVSGYLINKLKKEFLQKNYKIKLVKQDISKLLDVSTEYEVVICVDILEHIKEIENAISNIHDMLKKGGLLFMTLPWNEEIINNMVICPYCKNKFHPIGHFHSFKSIEDIKNFLGGKFQITEIDFCKPVDLNLINNIFYFLKKTILRPLYFKKGKPKYLSTIFVKAKKF
jgi:2-polyprenyl-3-methyl-5-hydroxy-6-metoxy-1,4-benzoquinol methylase